MTVVPRNRDLHLELHRAWSAVRSAERERDQARAEAQAAKAKLRLVDLDVRRERFDEAVEHVMLGRTQEGLAALRELLEVDPSNWEYQAWVSQAEEFIRWEREHAIKA